MVSIFRDLKSIDWIVLVSWAMYPLGTYVIAAFAKLPVIGDMSSVIVPLFILIMLMQGENIISKKIRIQDVAFVLLVALLFVFGLNSSVSTYLIPYAEPLLLTALPLFFVGLFVDIERLKKPIYIISILCILTQFLYVFFYEQTKSTTVEELTEERMHTSYQILPHVLFVSWTMIRNFHFSELLKMKNLIGGLTSVLGFMMILSYGARGPLVCYVAFFMMYLLFVVGLFKKRGVRFFIIALVGTLFIFMDQIIFFLYETLESFGVSTRIVDLFLQNEFINSSSTNERQVIAVATINDIFNNLLLGRGMAGDRFAVHGAYCHNFALEIWASYGIIFGTLMLISLAILFLRALIKGDSIEKTFLLLLLSAGFLKLFMSGTYIEERYFFFAIGYSLNVIRQHQRAQKLTKKYEVGYIRT